MVDLNLSCHCGEFKAIAKGVGPGIGNRIVCYCKSCQDFPEKLGKADIVVDEYGGTEIYQIPPAKVVITQGEEQLRCLRHTDDGLHRFYTACCDHPIANSPGKKMPFIGLIHSSDPEPEKRQERLGPIRCHTFTDDVLKPLPADRQSNMTTFLVRVIFQIFSWRLRGLGQPHPFFEEDGACKVEPEVR